jgi:peptide deformylase
VSTLEIAQIGAPVLRQRAREVGPDALQTPEMQQLVDDIVETMRHAKGAGLAAPQVHRSVRICAIEVDRNPRYPYKPDIPLTILINPVLTPLSSATFENYEGCLSVPNLRGLVRRHAELRLDALDRHGNPVRREVRGITAGTFQHEIDHLDGLLFVDRVTDTRTLCTWNEFAQHHEPKFRATVEKIVARYGS